MASYVQFDIESGIVDSLFSWRDAEISKDYPKKDGHDIIEIDDELFQLAQMEFINNKLRLVNRGALTFKEMFRTVDKTIEEFRKEKKAELNQECNKAIVGTFSCDVNGGTYYFSCDSEAQSNFEKVDRAFEKGRTTEEKWTAYDSNGNVYRLTLDIDSFEVVYLAHLNHIRNNISKFRDVLEPQVNNAKTITEILSIEW